MLVHVFALIKKQNPNRKGKFHQWFGICVWGVSSWYEVPKSTKTFGLFVCLLVLQGYFQLKANPGSWILRLREGRSEEIYEIFQ